MLSTTDQLIFGVFIVLVIIVIIVLILRIKKYKRIARILTPIRYLNKEDLEAINFLEIDGNLSINLLIFKRLPKKKIYKSVWQFSNVSFKITTVYRHKRITHHFFLDTNGEIIEIIIPKIFLSYLTEETVYLNKNIEVLFRLDHFVLYAIDGVIGYPSLYEKFKIEQNSIETSSLRREPTKKELAAFSFSKWSNTWGLIFPILFSMSFLGVLEEGLGISIVFTPFLILVCIPFFKAYKKRKKYIDSRIIHKLNGTIWFDEKKYVYRINDDELRLHRKWRKVLKKKLPLENVKMEALLHTYDNLDLEVCRKFQPIALKSNYLNINETNLKSTRSWGVAFLYAISFGAVAYLSPNFAYKGNIIMDPKELLNITDNYVFILIMTLIWWASIIITLYLTYLIISRVSEFYFIRNKH